MVDGKGQAKDFKKKICQYIIKRMEHKNVGIKTSSTMYEKEERFGSFCDRAIQALRPNWLLDEQKLRINELMYNIVVDKKNFGRYSNEILSGSVKNWEWDQRRACQCIRKLISRNGSFEFVDDDGNDCVMMAAKFGYNEILKEILKHPRKIYGKRQNREGMCLLMIALYYRKVETGTLNKLLSVEHDFSIRDKKKRTIMVHTMNIDNSLVKNKIIALGATDIQPKIVEACKNDDVDVIKNLHSRGLKLTARVDDYGSTVACQAAAHGSSRILQYCCRAADGLGLDFADATPLHYACHFERVREVRTLLEFSVDVNARDSNGETPLLCAATRGAPGVCQMLIDAGADVNIKDEKGTSHLMRSAAYGHKEVCLVLIEARCDVNYHNSLGEDAVILAKKHGQKDIADLIFDSQIHE